MPDGYNGKMCDDGVMMEVRDTVIVLSLPKKGVSRKPFGARLNTEATKKNNGVGVYEIPKSDTYVYVKEKLADGSVVQVTRFKPIPQSVREAAHAKATAMGLKMLPLTTPKERKDDGPARNISIDDMP